MAFGTGRICAVIVTYNPQPSLIQNIDAIISQVEQVVVVDNSVAGDSEIILQKVEVLEGCTVLRNYRNLGIAAALNRGLRFAVEAGYDWLITLDQDSKVCDAFVSMMLDTYHHDPHPENVAIIAPTYIDRKSGLRGTLMHAKNGEILTTMTSGSFMAASVITATGPFDESLYMDYVDIDFCLRVRRNRMSILQSPATLFHSLGASTYHRLLGMKFETTNHSAGRRYYITRNRLRLLSRYSSDWPWVWRECKAMFYEAAKIILAEDNTCKKIRAMIVGALHALRGKAGKQVEL